MAYEPTKPRLNDVFPEWLAGGGIFSTLQTLSVPWQDKNMSLALDMEYHGNVSGEKIVSPLIEKIRTGDVLTPAEKTLIANSIFAVCGENWSKQWDTMSFEYDPIENYSMTEQMLDDETVTTYGKTRTANVNQNAKTYGFNSPTSAPIGENVGTQTDADGGSDNNTRNYTLTRSGNIGVTTSQQMIESERKLWEWKYFLDVVFPDIDRVLTLQIY